LEYEECRLKSEDPFAIAIAIQIADCRMKVLLKKD